MAKVNVKSSGAALDQSVASGADQAAGGGIAPRKRLHEVTDALGRTITYEKPTAYQNMNLFTLVDNKAAQSQGYMLYARLASSVRKIIDPNREAGLPKEIDRAFPNSKLQLDALVQLLDEEGINAVMSGWVANGWISIGQDDANAQEDQAAAEAKN